MTPPPKERLPWYTKLFYGAGDFGFAFVDSCVAVLFAIFMTDVVGLPAKMAALAVFVGKSWDWINDPIIGYLCDRTRTRWGRRRPFLLFGFIPFGLAFLMMWWIPPTAAVPWVCSASPPSSPTAWRLPWRTGSRMIGASRWSFCWPWPGADWLCC